MVKLTNVRHTVVVVAAFVVLACIRTAADVVRTYNLTAANTSLCPTASCPVYAAVKIQIQGNTAIFAVTSPVGLGFFGSGGPMFGFNFRDENGTLIGATVGGFSNPALSQTRSGRQMAEYGRFDFAITGPSANRALSSFSFTMTCPACNTSNPLTFRMFEFTPQLTGGSYFAAHAICYSCSGNTYTGFVGQNPEPASIVLVVTGSLALAGWVRRRK